MSYNLQPLITILEKLLNPEERRWKIRPNKRQLKSLLEKASSLEQILEKSTLQNLGIESDLESQIREAAHKAEDIIESHMVDKMLLRRPRSRFTFPQPELQQVIEELDTVEKQAAKLMEGKEEEKMSRGGSTSSGADPSVVVGVDEDLRRLTDRLTGAESKLEIVPIVGMGGIGKTTLARKLYHDSSIVSRFSYRAWATVSQDYSMKDVLSCLLRCVLGKGFDQRVGDKTQQTEEEKIHELKDTLYKSLYGRKYMVVLDDVWSTAFWDEMRIYFPNNTNGSRIVITTRESDIAKHTVSQSLQPHHQVQLLSKSDSWELLSRIVFGGEECPSTLQATGEKIASDCGELPLAISVIGGILSKVERSRNEWLNVANDVRAQIAESDEQFSNILSLSYNHLPNHLRPCFLYMGAFPEDHEVKASTLIYLWVAEGFVKSNGNSKSLEEEGEDYLKALVERNLVLVRRNKFNGTPKSYIMHDLLRDLCVKKAREEKFLLVNEADAITFCSWHRVSVHTPQDNEDMLARAEAMPFARTYIRTDDDWFRSLSRGVFELRLLPTKCYISVSVKCSISYLHY